ncbi:MAG: Ig-like domain repeat protein [Gemmataceae bacterium]
MPTPAAIGTFYVQVDTFSFQNNPNFSAAAIAKYAARNADGSLVDPSRADGLYHTDTGAYELLIYRFNARNASAGADHLGSTATLNVGTVFGDAVTVTVDGAWANVNGQTVQPSPGPVNLLIDAGTNHALQLSGTVVNGVATFDVKAAGAGPHTFQAIYQGDTILDGSTSAITTASVAPAPASASLNAPTITYGAHAQVTVSLSSSVAMPQGDVTLTVDGVIFATQTLSGGVTTFDVGALNAGAHAMSARFTALHGNYTASDVSGTLTVNQRAVTVTADAKTKLYGAVDPVLTYHITSGSLAMGDGFSGALTRQAGEALGSYAILQGTLALSANYALQYVGATFTITGATTATALVASSGTHYFGQSVTFTANVTADSGAAAVGSVDFFDITTGVDLGVVNVASGSASLTISSLVAGAHAIRATFTGAVGFVGSSASTNVAIVGDSIVVLNQTMAGALSISGNGHVQVDGIVDVESSSASAISASGNAIIGAAAVRTAGAFSRSGNAQINPPATTHAARLGDPLAGLAAPSIAGLVNRGSLSIGGNTTQTINPGIYTQISLSGNAKVTLNPGVYVIAGGGFTVTGNAAVTGAGIFIYNAGSNYANNGAPGGTFGGLTLGGAGKIDLAPAGAGVYAGILVYQARDNTRALSLSGNGTLLHGGLLYVPAGLVTESGSGQLQASIVANQVQVSGNAYNTLTDEGTESTSFTAGQLLAGDLVVYLDNEAGAFTPEEIARIEDAISVINVVINPFNVHIIEVGAADRDLATLVIHSAETSAVGGALDGVLGCEGAGLITVVQGWNWYAGADTNAVGPDQFDFETIVMHELGHALGLGHSEDTSSVMYATLATGEARRSLTVADLAIPDLDDGPCGLHVAGMGQRDEARGRSADASGGAFGLTAVAPDVVQAAASFASGLAPTEIVSAQVVHGTSATILSAPVPSAMAIAASETTLAAQSTAWQTGAGADVLIGGAGADLLLGETGSAMLLGGFGGSEQAPEQHQKQATNAESETNGVTRIESAVDVGGAHSDTLTTALGAWLDDASGLDQQIGADSQGDWLDVSCLALLGAIPALLACDGGVERRSRLLSGVANSLTPREPLG